MKLLLTKCQICYDWYSPKRSHCPCCGAARIRLTQHENIHINPANESRPGILMVNGFSHFHFSEHALEIANVLMGKD